MPGTAGGGQRAPEHEGERRDRIGRVGAGCRGRRMPLRGELLGEPRRLVAAEARDRGDRVVEPEPRRDEHAVAAGEGERGRAPVTVGVARLADDARVEQARRQPGDGSAPESGGVDEFAAGRRAVRREMLDDEGGLFAVGVEGAGDGGDGRLAGCHDASMLPPRLAVTYPVRGSSASRCFE
ncbi:hypothetical protein GCM10009761_06330 [Agromyces terreus]